MSAPQTNFDERVGKAKEKLKGFANLRSEEQEKVTNLTNKIADGYVQSIHMIVDVSQLITSYKMLLDGLLTEIEAAGLDSKLIASLSGNTNNKLVELENYISANFKNLKEIAAVSGEPGKKVLDQVKILGENITSTKESLIKKGGSLSDVGKKLRPVLRKMYSRKANTKK